MHTEKGQRLDQWTANKEELFHIHTSERFQKIKQRGIARPLACQSHA